MFDKINLFYLSDSIYEKIIVLKIKIMKTIAGYKVKKEKKKQIVYARMDTSMIKKLKEIRLKQGISSSEIIREAVRRLLKDVEEKGRLKLDI